MTALQLRSTGRVLLLALASMALAACTPTTTLVSQWGNPEFVGRPFKRVLVIGVTPDPIGQRIFEDQMVAQLGARGVNAVQGYMYLPANQTGPVPEPQMRDAVKKAGADAILLTRATRTTERTTVTPAVVAGPMVGVGWGGFYGMYSGMWPTAGPFVVDPGQVITTTYVIAETRLFEASNGALAWAGTTSSQQQPSGGSNTMIQQFVQVLVDAMARDRVI
jgi:hypothetical protein